MSQASPAAPAEGSPIYRHVLADTRRGMTLSDIAGVTGVGERTVQNWARGSSRPVGQPRDRLLELRYIVGQLSDVYEDEGIDIWLHAPQRRFGGRRPLDLLREGEFERVLEAIEMLAGGPKA